MAIDLEKLNPELKTKLLRLLALCHEKGIEMRPYCGLRDPFEQARLWRQSRSAEEIQEKLNELENNGAPFLADCIRRVGPQHGDPVTNTPPGFSWHQWGEAVDCFWLVNGKTEWSTTKQINGLNGYKVFADEAESIGLTAGGHWRSFKDWPHLQLRKEGNATDAMTLPEIDAAMKARFGD